MKSTELIRKFPEKLTKPILYVVYDDSHIAESEFLIETIHGKKYLDRVKIIALNTSMDSHSTTKDYDVYIDPMVYTYKHSWNN